MRKLQRAILTTGLVVKASTNQFYSDEQGRMITIYVLSTPTLQKGKNDSWSTKDYVILKTTSVIEIVKCLADIWEQTRGW